MKKISFLLITLFTLSSCEKETFVDYYIDNQSSTKISVNGTNIISSISVDNEINSNEKKEVSSWSKRGKETDFFEPITMFGQDLIITNVSGDSLIKDYKDISNWNSDVYNERTQVSHEYILVISDSDF
tara:strand:- start:13 stop:396 length:384 start_codon:yes stop_codon:yes gene_type:complete